MKKKKEALTVIIPCYNEKDNIKECISRVPYNDQLDTEIIVVDDGSTDNTSQIARSTKKKNLTIIRYENNRGKGYAVRKALKAAKGDIAIILDADMSSPPEEIPNAVLPIYRNKADFVNSTRLIYKMEKGAMKWLHIPGNRMFAFLVSLIIKHKLTDSLCGLKAFRRKMLPHSMLKEDSWPDFELLIKAGRLGLRIVEVPIHYKARKANASKMHTFSHGYKMFKMLVDSLRK